jgi:hypothetical protein
MKAIYIVATLAMTACGQSQPTASTVKDATNAPSLCEFWAKSDNLAASRVVQPRDQELSKFELGMVQHTVLHVTGEPVTPAESLAIFTDADNGGSLGGQIEYYEIGGKTLANVTYYPGDNEYGLLFQVWTFDDGSQSLGMIGSIGDSDRYCLTYVE